MFNLSSNTNLVKSLACVALTPGLRSIVVFDAPYEGLRQIADLLAQLLRVATDQRVQHYDFVSFEVEDDLWGYSELPGHVSSQRLFSRKRNAQELQLLTVADLTNLSLAATRTCMMLVGADVVHLERNGQHEAWHPQQCWLAGCTQERVGTISPHLLDRFALRLSWNDLLPDDVLDHEGRAQELLESIPEPPETQPVVPQCYLDMVVAARDIEVFTSSEACAHLLQYLPEEEYYLRRELVLARFALALARLVGERELTTERVDEAASMLGFSLVRTIEDEEPEHKQSAPTSASANQLDSSRREAGAQASDTSVSASKPPEEEPVYAPEATHDEIFDNWPLSSDPYPEDGAPVEREMGSLKMPFMRYAQGRATRGPIVGIEPSETLEDLAITSTILAAARHHTPADGRKLTFEIEDLRRYRRGAVAEHMLMLLLDYTSVREVEGWQEALYLYLREAYIRRASVVMVKVGERRPAGGAELKAEMVSAKSILVPRVSTALEAEPGRFTPLAHGLSLAIERLHKVLQHGRSTVRHVTLVVVSDGRGNVPLAVSQRERREGIVRLQGVEDALEIARQIQAFKRVEAVVLTPILQQYPELPKLLAEALGARLEVIEPLAQGEEQA